MSDTDKKPTRRRVTLPTKQKKGSIDVVSQSLNTPTDILLHDAKCIIASELAHYRTKVTGGRTLDLKEARVIQGYLDSLTKLQKEEREQSRAEDLSNLSDEELLAIAQQLFVGNRPEVKKQLKVDKEQAAALERDYNNLEADAPEPEND